ARRAAPRRGRDRAPHRRHGHRYRRLDPRAAPPLVRVRRPQADLWPGQPAWHPAALLLAGPCRPAPLDQRGLRADAAGAGAGLTRVMRSVDLPMLPTAPARRRPCAASALLATAL